MAGRLSDPALFAACLEAWIADLWPGRHEFIAIDGKTARRTHDRGKALKGNQPTLEADVPGYFRTVPKSEVVTKTALEKGHGRIETRAVTIMHDIDWLRQRHNWPGQAALAMVDSVREIDRTRAPLPPHLLTPAGRQACPRHPRPPERREQPALVMDMTFRDDESRVRTANAPANFAAIRPMALNLVRTRKGKLSVKANLKAAAWNDDHLIRRLVA